MSLAVRGGLLQALCLCLTFSVFLASSTPTSKTANPSNKAHVSHPTYPTNKGPPCPADSEVARVESTGPRDLSCATRVSISHDGVVVNGHGNQMCRCMPTYKCGGCPNCTLNGKEIFSPGPGTAHCKKDIPDVSPTPKPTPEPHSSEGASNSAGVIAGTVGSVVLLGMAGGGFVFYRRHRAARPSTNGENDPLVPRSGYVSSDDRDTWAYHGPTAVNNLKPNNSMGGVTGTRFSPLKLPRTDAPVHTGQLYPSFSDAGTSDGGCTNSTVDYDAMSDVPSSAGVSTTTYETAVTSHTNGHTF